MPPKLKAVIEKMVSSQITSFTNMTSSKALGTIL